MQRGIVIDIQSKHWVVLTEDGLFIKVPKQDSHVQIGEEVSYSYTNAQMPAKRNWKIYLSGAVAAIFALFFLVSSFIEDQAFAETQLYVEIDPGIEIGLNDKMEVVRVRPLKEEAKKLLNQSDWKRESAVKFVVHYLKRAKKQGYLQKNDEIVLSAINDKKSNQSTLYSIRSTIEQDPEIGKDALSLDIFTFSLPEVILKKAGSTGLTPGKYGVWLLSRRSGKEIPLDQVSKMPISDLKVDDNLLNHPPTEKEWKEIVGKVEKETETEQKNTTKPSNKTEQPSSSDQSNNKEKKPTEQTQDPKNPPNQKDKSKFETLPAPNKEKESEKPQSNPNEKDPEEKENSTSGSTEDSNPETNHAAP